MNLFNSHQLASRLRNHVVDMTSRGNSSHVGSCLSIIDIISVLFTGHIKYLPSTYHLPISDRFILSKGHAGAAVYSLMAELGFFPLKLLETHYQNGSFLSGHVSHKDVPGVTVSTGSLGHGPSIGIGLALAARHRSSRRRVYVLLSDGECDEGSVWEAAMFASHHSLGNLCFIIDYNKLQSLDSISNTIGLEPFADKWLSFGWNVISTDGHDHTSLSRAFIDASTSIQPTVIICNTIKGKGVSFMENSVLWHYRSPQLDEYDTAKAELNQPL